MHSFLRSMGYGSIKQNTQLEQLINLTVEDPEIYSNSCKCPDGTVMVEYTRRDLSFGGIRVYGEEDDAGQFHFGTYAPIGFAFDGTETESDIYINKRVDSDSYTGMCDDARIGISLIFFITNPVENSEIYDGVKVLHNKVVQLFALAQSGKIILPTLMSVTEKEKVKQDAVRKNQLIAEAKKGNPEAIESLTINDIDNYAMVSQRIKNEDILSIVDTSLSPCGSESDMYNITGTINFVESEKNRLTGEKVWHLKISCNNIPIDVFINDNDLLGEPLEGRRFRGSAWLQGKITE